MYKQFFYFILCILLIYLTLVSGCSVEREVGMKLSSNWKYKTDSLNLGLFQKWYEIKVDKNDWKKIAVPDYFDNFEIPNYDGVVWY